MPIPLPSEVLLTYYNTLQLAAVLNIHPMSVPRLVKQKRIPKPKKMFGKNWWLRVDVERWLEHRAKEFER